MPSMAHPALGTSRAVAVTLCDVLHISFLIAFLSGFSSVTQLLCVTLSAHPQNKRQAFRPAFVLHAYLIDGKHSMPAVREHPLQRQTKLLRPQSEI